jgi:hypothetical protein
MPGRTLFGNSCTQINHRILFTNRVVEHSFFHLSCERKVELGVDSDRLLLSWTTHSVPPCLQKESKHISKCTDFIRRANE